VSRKKGGVSFSCSFSQGNNLGRGGFSLKVLSIGVVTSSADDGVGSSFEITSWAMTGALPTGSMARSPNATVKNAVAKTAGNPRPANRDVHRILFPEIINIFCSSFPIFIQD
jgi:hypothetical protein